MGLLVRNVAGIDIIEKPGDPEAPHLMLLHGFGADFEDLAPLSQVVHTPENFHWIFPNGPLEVPIGPWMTGRAWFPLDVQAMESAIAQGQFSDFSEVDPPGLTEAADRIQTLISKLNINYSNLYLGGFSQGAMVAIEAVLSQSEQPRGLIVLSGTLAAQKRWGEGLKNHQGLRIFQSHGRNDPLLSFHEAVRLNELFKKYKTEERFFEFSGGHEIPLSILQELEKFLS